MQHFFVTKKDRLDDSGHTLKMTGEDYHHIAHVLRMKAGEEISVSVREEADDVPKEYRYGIDEITEDAVICSLRFVRETAAELPAKVTLFQGLPKSDKMEWIIEKTVELGVHEIVPVMCARCVTKYDQKKQASRVTRWNKIALSAAKQARRAQIPEVREIVSFQEAVRDAAAADVRLIPYELAGEMKDVPCSMDETRRRIDAIEQGQRVAVFIGPEGGFAEQEIREAMDAGFVPVTLGARILRTETAGMTVMAWLMYGLSQ